MNSLKQRAFFTLLSDSALQPAALLLNGPTDDLAGLLSHPSLQALLGSLPCVIRATSSIAVPIGRGRGAWP